jgi:hypothetical protein
LCDGKPDISPLPLVHPRASHLLDNASHKREMLKTALETFRPEKNNRLEGKGPFDHILAENFHTCERSLESRIELLPTSVDGLVVGHIFGASATESTDFRQFCNVELFSKPYSRCQSRKQRKHITVQDFSDY